MYDITVIDVYGTWSIYIETPWASARNAFARIDNNNLNKISDENNGFDISEHNIRGRFAHGSTEAGHFGPGFDS